MNLTKFLDFLACFGTSEGVKKGWEVRERKSTQYGGGQATRTTYSHMDSDTPDVIYVTERGNKAKVEHSYMDEYDKNGESHFIHEHEGTPKSAAAYLKDEYGIDHNSDMGRK